MKSGSYDPAEDINSRPDNWEPEEKDRVHYRHLQTGDLGYLVRRDGRSVIRLDRSQEEILKPFSKVNWALDNEHRPMSKHQVTRIAFAADKALCACIGLHDKARKEFEDLTEGERIRWAEKGPTGKIERMRMYRAVHKALEPFVSS